MTQFRLALLAAGMLVLNWPAFAFDIKLAADNSSVLAGAFSIPWVDALRCDIGTAGRTFVSPASDDVLAIPASEFQAPPESEPMGASEPLPEINETLAVGGGHMVEAVRPSATPQYKDLWERIRAGFQLPRIRNNLVAKHQAQYLTHR